MGREKLSNPSLDPGTVRTLVAAYHAVWAQVEPLTDSKNIGDVRNVIADALLDLCKVGAAASRAA